MPMVSQTVLGIIGGSGIYDFIALSNKQWRKVATPFGAASDELLFGNLDGQAVVFLPRHGRNHNLAPHEINYRANIDVLKRSGVTDLISLSAVGSFHETISPGDLVIVDQFVDRTYSRLGSFFGNGLVAHVSMAKPTCTRLGDVLQLAALNCSVPINRGGTYVVVEGPQFSTLAESNLYRLWGMSVIGMTNMPEAKLAREAEICYATVAMVTDYDCWHPEYGDVQVAEVLDILSESASKVSKVVTEAAPILNTRPDVCSYGCDRALDSALVTRVEAADSQTVTDLDAVAGRVLRRG